MNIHPVISGTRDWIERPFNPIKVGGITVISTLILAALFLVVDPSLIFAQEAKQSTPEYRIGIGDILEIVTWKEPDFSRGEILVRTDGKISFPLLDDVPAAGLTPSQLKKKIEANLKEYVSTPNVTVTIRNAGSQRFYILGEVVNTGEYPLNKNLTVLQAFALAGGFTEWASKKEIILFRNENGKEKVIRINYKDIVKGKDFRQNVVIKADDTIIVP
jgi:polysaccharide export outer membrane protein